MKNNNYFKSRAIVVLIFPELTFIVRYLTSSLVRSVSVNAAKWLKCGKFKRKINDKVPKYFILLLRTSVSLNITRHSLKTLDQ